MGQICRGTRGLLPLLHLLPACLSSRPLRGRGRHRPTLLTHNRFVMIHVHSAHGPPDGVGESRHEPTVLRRARDTPSARARRGINQRITRPARRNGAPTAPTPSPAAGRPLAPPSRDKMPRLKDKGVEPAGRGGSRADRVLLLRGKRPPTPRNGEKPGLGGGDHESKDKKKTRVWWVPSSGITSSVRSCPAREGFARGRSAGQGCTDALIAP